MVSHPNRMVRFFRELRRRRVFRTFVLYGTTAFILMEAADIMLPRLGLPEWTVTFVIVLLIIGFPIALVLSWIFDLTPEGIQKTAAAAEEDQTDAGHPTGQSKGFTLSHAIIVVLLVVVGILVYPKIFSGDQYKTVRNEAGQISLAVLPFANQTGDSSMNWLCTGISSLLTNGLGSSEELLVYNDQGMGEIIDGNREISAEKITGLQAKDIAGKAGAQAYITGSFHGRGDKYRILANLVSTERGDILLSSQVEGNLISDAGLELVDSLCSLIREQLEIRALEQEVDFDFRKAYTNSAEAYRHYIDGMNAVVRGDFDYSLELLTKALEIDSSFAFAAFYIAMALNMNASSFDTTAVWVKRAHELKSGLPMIYQQWIDLWYIVLVDTKRTKLNQQLSTLESAGIESRLFWYDLGVTHQVFTRNLDQALKNYERVLQINDKRGETWLFPNFYLSYGRTLYLMGRYQEGEKMLRKGLELTTAESRRNHVIYWWAISAIRHGDSALASELIEDFRLSKVKLGELDSYEVERCRMFYHAKDFERAEVETRLFLLDHPNDKEGTKLLVDILIEGELDPQAGLELVNALLEEDPEKVGLVHSKACALHKLGRHQEALELLEMNTAKYKIYYAKHHSLLQEVREAISGGL